MPTIETSWPDFMTSTVSTHRKAQAVLRRARRHGVHFTMKEILWILS